MENKKIENKSKIHKILLIIIILLSIIECILTILDIIECKKCDCCVISNDQQLSTSQSAIDIPVKESKEDSYTEIIGYGTLEIDYDYPYVYLQNPSENDVYMSFDVQYNGNTLYSSGLIAPGNMEQFNVFRCLDAGQHMLTYIISTYDMQNRNVLWSGIQQNQNVLIKK